MNKNHKYYNTEYKDNQSLSLVLLIIFFVLFIGGILLASGAIETQERGKYTPDVSYPMTNVNISWEQTFHSGAWSET